jgi:HPt (histidine-containing phosphotransfer) domain-containing protein
MKLTLRFVVLISALLLSVAASASAGWRALARLDGALDAVVKNDMERLLAITHSRRLFRSLVVLERDYLLTNSLSERDLMDRKLTVAARELEQQINKYAKLMPAGDAASIEDIRGVRRRWLERDARVRDAARRGDANALSLSARHADDPVSWETVIGGLVNANEKRLADEVAGTHATYGTARKTLLAVSLAAALLAASLGYLIFAGIRRNVRELSALNDNLEGLVAERTLALSERERSLRLVLDSTGDGIINVQSDGTLSGNASAAATQWFGPLKAGGRASTYLFPEDASSEALFRLGLDQLVEDLMPRQVVLEQMPQRIVKDELILDVSYRQVLGDSSVTLLVLVRDVTARVHSEHGEQEARERQSLVGKLLIDKLGFANFVRDAEHLIQALESERDVHVARRHLHTLKGNVAVYGLGSMARLCHRIEDRLAETPGLPSVAEVAALSAMLRDKLKGIEEFLIGLGRDAYEVETEEHAAVVQSLLDRKDHEEILHMVEVWTWPRVVERLGRARAECEYLARRLDKQLTVELEHGDLRLPAGYLDHFWPTLSHVLRNAVDHGIETPEVRVAAGKPPTGSLRLRASQTDEQFVLEVEDDGGGIDLEAVKAAGRARGLDWRDDAEALDLIFRDGLSTHTAVSEVSGRGVGLPALRAACDAESGSMELYNRPGHGVRFVFSFRRPVVDTAALAAKLAQRWILVPEAQHKASMTMRRARPRLAL